MVLGWRKLCALFSLMPSSSVAWIRFCGGYFSLSCDFRFWPLADIGGYVRFWHKADMG